MSFAQIFSIFGDSRIFCGISNFAKNTTTRLPFLEIPYTLSDGKIHTTCNPVLTSVPITAVDSKCL